jgi:hypothetical protein
MQKITLFARKANGAFMGSAGGSFAVYLAGTTTPVAVYTTDSTAAPAPSSSIPATGKIEFYARNGRIKVVATEGAETVLIDDIAVVASILSGAIGDRPAAGSADRLYFATDIGRLYRDNESAWEVYPDFALDAMDWAAAADKVAAATTDLFGGAGNYVEVTHASGTLAITALANANAPEGSPRLAKFTISGGTLSLTHNATSLEILNGGANWTLADGDMAWVIGKGGGNVKVIPVRASGLSALEMALQADMEAASSTTKAVPPGRMIHHPGIPKVVALITVSGGVPSLVAGVGYGVASIVDTATGRVTLNFSTPFSSTNYVVQVTAERATNSTPSPGVSDGTRAVGSVELFHNPGSLGDPVAWHVCIWGDQ